MDRIEFVEALQRGVDEFNVTRRKFGAEAQDLSGGDFSGCDLKGAQLARMVFRNSNFDRSDLTNANLSHCDLTGATFRGARVVNVNLHKAVLKDADFRGATLGGFDKDGRMCLNVASFRGVKWGKAELESILEILDQNEEWEIRYQLVPRNRTVQK